MPPHLHPRSAATSTLFAGTLVASFVVVAIPHILPCPVPRRVFADSDGNLVDEKGNPIQSRKDKKPQRNAICKTRDLQDEALLFRQLQQEAEALDKQARECPVPKPTGWIGKMMGFNGKGRGTNEMTSDQTRG